MSNRLAGEFSPFLLAHKDDPIDWRPFGQAAFDEAKESGKPVYLSIGFSACHWCHVMQRESFSDPETAALVNAQFIPVLVDRLQRPDIDQLYQAAANTLGHSGGWPLTAFLDPSGAMFFTSSYLPREDQFNAPSFKRVLSEIGKTYREQPQTVAANIARSRDALKELWATERRGPLNNALLDHAAVAIGQRYDIFYGGITGAPKFPAPHLIEFVWRSYLRTGLDQFSQITHTTLHNVCMGGIYDHLAGGFFRYSADERWVVPHFEKMLYDNAQMIEILLSLAQHNRWPLFIDRIHETVAFLLRDLRVGEAFAACIDADSEGEEGRYYVWSEAEIDAALKGTFASRFKEVYNITREGQAGGKNVLHRLGNVAGYPIGEADETLFGKQRGLLLAARAKRAAPYRDEQILADWNGMAIAALARAGSVFNKPEWVAAAAATFDFICRALGDGDRLFHVWLDGKRGKEGFADDYAMMIKAAVALFQATQDARYIEHARGWTRFMNEHFWDPVFGAYCATADDAEPLFMRPRLIFDQIVPCANATMLGELCKLFLITNDTVYRDRLNGILTAFAGDMPRAAISMPTYLSAFETALMSLQIVVIGPKGNAKTKSLIEAVRSRSLPAHALIVVERSEDLPEGHAIREQGMHNGEPTAYICQNGAASPPFTNPVALSQQLILPPQVGAAARAQANAGQPGTPPRPGTLN